MGSWVGLDANYPPGTLIPATAFVVALGHLVGATSVFADDTATRLATFLPRHGLDYDHDLLTRAERYLGQVPIEPFLDETRALLNPSRSSAWRSTWWIRRWRTASSGQATTRV